MKKPFYPIVLCLVLFSFSILFAADPPNIFPVIYSYVQDTSALGEGEITLAVTTDVEGFRYRFMLLNNDGSIYKY